MPCRFSTSRRSSFCALFALALFSVHSAAADGQFTTTHDGVKIYYDTVGSGTAIFMIAGGPGGSSARFCTTHTLLRSCGKLVFLDNRGRGRSEEVRSLPNQPGVYSLDTDLIDVEAVRLAIGAERIVIYGHSYGSMVAMAYASRFPQNTLGLITTAGTHGASVWQERNIDGVKKFLSNHFPKRWKQIVELHDAGQLTGRGELADLFKGIEELYNYHPDSKDRKRPANHTLQRRQLCGPWR